MVLKFWLVESQEVFLCVPWSHRQLDQIVVISRRPHPETTTSHEIKEMQAELSTAITDLRQLPQELHCLLGEALSCCVCHDIMTPLCFPDVVRDS